MKKIILLSLFLTSNVFAQMAIPMDGVGVMTGKPANPGAIGRAFKWGAEKLVKTPMTKVGTVAAECLVSKKLCATVVAGGATLAYLYDHPEVVEHYLQKHPEKYDDVHKYFEYRKSQVKNPEQLVKYEKAEEDVGLNERSIADQLDIEVRDPDFSKILAALSQMATVVDTNKEMEDYTKNTCSINVAKTLVELKPAVFNAEINIYLPKKNIAPEILFSYDKYGNLKSKARVMESDHIPSYKALEYFFINKQVSFTGQTKADKRYANLQSNASAVIIPFATHKGNRTSGRKNETLAVDDGASATNLRNATLKDFATLLWFEKNNQANFDALVDVLPKVYVRNKMLCLYDLDNNMSNTLSVNQIKNNLKNFDYQTLINQL